MVPADCVGSKAVGGRVVTQAERRDGTGNTKQGAVAPRSRLLADGFWPMPRAASCCHSERSREAESRDRDRRDRGPRGLPGTPRFIAALGMTATGQLAIRALRADAGTRAR